MMVLPHLEPQHPQRLRRIRDITETVVHVAIGVSRQAPDFAGIRLQRHITMILAALH